jgi:hypothetical protein
MLHGSAQNARRYVKIKRLPHQLQQMLHQPNGKNLFTQLRMLCGNGRKKKGKKHIDL